MPIDNKVDIDTSGPEMDVDIPEENNSTEIEQPEVKEEPTVRPVVEEKEGEDKTFENEREIKLDWYNDFLKDHTSKKLICTNPDLTVHRGNKEEYCAGYIAKMFEALGGKAIYYGKPHKEIYEMCFKPNEKVLAIGDNLRTDIKGANNLNKDCLFISNGVHRKEFSNNLELQKLLDKYKVKANYFQKELQW